MNSRAVAFVAISIEREFEKPIARHHSRRVVTGWFFRPGLRKCAVWKSSTTVFGDLFGVVGTDTQQDAKAQSMLLLTLPSLEAEAEETRCINARMVSFR